jgi:hypothetical protein
MGAAFTKTLDMAKRLGDVEYQLRALRGLYFYHNSSGRFRTAHPFAREFHALALRGSDRNDLMFGERMMGVTEHYIGHQMRARHHLEQVLALCRQRSWTDAARFQDVVPAQLPAHLDPAVPARVLWLQGFADQAVRMAERSWARLRRSHATLAVPFLSSCVSDRVLGGRPRRGRSPCHAGRSVAATERPPFLGEFGAR